jgi:hypothetical protein
LPRALPARYVPPSGFGYPLGGFLPSIPCRFCFTPAALLGFTLRSFLLWQGIRRVTDRKDPLTVSPAVVPDAVALGRPDRPRFLGFIPCESPWPRRMCLAPPRLDAPMGFALLGSTRRSLGRDSAQPPLSRFAKPATNRRPHRRPRVSIDSCLALTFRRGEPRRGGQDNPCRVSAPA